MVKAESKESAMQLVLWLDKDKLIISHGCPTWMEVNGELKVIRNSNLEIWQNILVPTQNVDQFQVG